MWIRPWPSVAGTPLHPVHARFPPELSVDTAPTDQKDRFLDRPGDPLRDAHQLDRPVLPLGVADVHAHEVAGEQPRLVATAAGSHLDHRGSVLHRVFRKEELAHPYHESLEPLLELGRLVLRQLAQLGVAVLEHPARLIQVAHHLAQLCRRASQGLQAGSLLAQGPEPVLVTVHRGIAQLLVELSEPAFGPGQALLEPLVQRRRPHL